MIFTTLYENERGWVGSSSFYEALGRLGIDYRLYELPVPYVLSADELNFYVESILNDLRGKCPSVFLDYVLERCKALKNWAAKGYIVHVVKIIDGK